MSEELMLMPCPACGHERPALEDDDFSYVECVDCGLTGPTYVKEGAREAAIAAWNALPRRLRWTKENPTEPGWYWFRYPNGRKSVWHISGDVVTSHKGVIMALDKVQILGGEWAGPIPEPEE